MSFVNVYQFVCVLLSFWFEGGVWDSLVLVPDPCESFYFGLLGVLLCHAFMHFLCLAPILIRKHKFYCLFIY